MTADLYRRSDKALFSNVGDDIVALHLENGHCYGMEKVSSVVWKLLEKPTDLDRICTHLVERYQVDEDRCRAEVGALLDQFQKEGLIEAVGA